ncbi:hypothetical protein NP493_1466g00016 [Ridgeia piscesae]|uniref:CHAP domain-containing protein n=1 Tax=Ridgeia piscesae TaxID=27915 RepID=A0AAD9NAR6_RIDPI|nr:hypothetical protein NP493_1466g00016 [Ridgeia piscesae]
MKTSLVLLLCCLVATTLACRPTGDGSTDTVPKAEKIAKMAESKVGSTLWSFASTHKTGANTNKCNIFVGEMIEAAGATVPHRHWWMWSPIGAAEWGSSSSSYLLSNKCWTLVSSTTDAKRGDVISDGHHVGIVTGQSLTTSASARTQNVVTNDWGFKASQNPTIWRYTC